MPARSPFFWPRVSRDWAPDHEMTPAEVERLLRSPDGGDVEAILERLERLIELTERGAGQ